MENVIPIDTSTESIWSETISILLDSRSKTKVWWISNILGTLAIYASDHINSNKSYDIQSSW